MIRCARCFEKFDNDPIADEFERRREELREAGEDASILCGKCEDERNEPIEPLDIESTFAAGGPLAGGNPNYEARPGQVRLSRAIHDALVDGKHLLAEGPCGIGKSKAYGVPAAHLAAQGKRVLIVTASIALQDQLVNKDLPALRREMPKPFTFELMKGRGNYLCLQQYETADNAGLTGADREDFDAISKWAKTTKTGDRGELLIKPSDLLWRRFSVNSDECPKRKCPSYEDCHATKARKRASKAGVIVTNYHLFFLDMASGGMILPSVDVVILDEAHEAADIARDLLGFRVSEGSFRRIASDAAKRGSVDLAEGIRGAAHRFFDKVLRFHDSPHYSKLVRWSLPIDPSELVDMLGGYLDAFGEESHLAASADRLIDAIKGGVEANDTDCVYSIEVKEGGRDRNAALVARYMHVGGVLSAKLWPAYRSVVAVSATLTTDNRFDFARRELGAPKDARELIVETPFDFRRQALLVVPPSASLPEPNDPTFLDVVAQYTIETIEACGGRTLGLFTSYKALNAVYERVCRHFRGRVVVMKQGDAPPGVLTERFKSDVSSVLLGTTSFWTGIDVPGEALTGLVIERLPFGQPDDPVSIKINETDRGAFGTYTVPKAILTFRQGAGRLIRSQRDIGAVVLLDRRLSTKAYGKRFLGSLPTMSQATTTAAIPRFLRARGVVAA